MCSGNREVQQLSAGSEVAARGIGRGDGDDTVGAVGGDARKGDACGGGQPTLKERGEVGSFCGGARGGIDSEGDALAVGQTNTAEGDGIGGGSGTFCDRSRAGESDGSGVVVKNVAGSLAVSDGHGRVARRPQIHQHVFGAFNQAVGQARNRDGGAAISRRNRHAHRLAVVVQHRGRRSRIGQRNRDGGGRGAAAQAHRINEVAAFIDCRCIADRHRQLGGIKNRRIY